jgi:hypothetical protein
MLSFVCLESFVMLILASDAAAEFFGCGPGNGRATFVTLSVGLGKMRNVEECFIFGPKELLAFFGSSFFALFSPNEINGHRFSCAILHPKSEKRERRLERELHFPPGQPFGSYFPRFSPNEVNGHHFSCAILHTKSEKRGRWLERELYLSPGQPLAAFSARFSPTRSTVIASRVQFCTPNQKIAFDVRAPERVS